MKIKSAIKLILSIVLFGIVLSFADIDKLKATFSKIDLMLAVLVVIGYNLGQLLSSVKWWLIARSGKIYTSYKVALKSYYIGMFVNCFGLGIVGGDIARGVLLADGKPIKAAAVTSVIADRFHGLAVLAVMGSLAVLIYGQDRMNTTLVVLLSSIAPIVLVGWILGPKLLLTFISPTHPFRLKAEEIVSVFPKNPKRLILITLMSAFFHTIQIGLHKLMAIGMGVDISWPELFICIPFANIMSSLPISWNGLGVRENAYVFLLAGIVTREEAVAFGAIWLLAVTVSSAIGGIISFITRDFWIFDKQLEDVPPVEFSERRAAP